MSRVNKALQCFDLNARILFFNIYPLFHVDLNIFILNNFAQILNAFCQIFEIWKNLETNSIYISWVMYYI